MDNPLTQAPVLLFSGMMAAFMLVTLFVSIDDARRRP